MNSLFSNPPQYMLFAPQILHKPLFSNAPGSTEFSQEHLKTITYAKLGGGGGGGNRAYYTLPKTRKNNKLLAEFDINYCTFVRHRDQLGKLQHLLMHSIQNTAQKFLCILLSTLASNDE